MKSAAVSSLVWPLEIKWNRLKKTCPATVHVLEDGARRKKLQEVQGSETEGWESPAEAEKMRHRPGCLRACARGTPPLPLRNYPDPGILCQLATEILPHTLIISLRERKISQEEIDVKWNRLKKPVPPPSGFRQARDSVL